VDQRVLFGVCLPLFANPGVFTFRTPCYETLDPQDSLTVARLAEDLGYDSVWVADLRDLLRLATQASPEEFRVVLASLLRARARQLESEIAALVRRHEEYQALVRRLLDEHFPPPGRCGCAHDRVTCRCSQVA